MINRIGRVGRIGQDKQTFLLGRIEKYLRIIIFHFVFSNSAAKEDPVYPVK
jgi:hypothetical protein